MSKLDPREGRAAAPPAGSKSPLGRFACFVALGDADNQAPAGNSGNGGGNGRSSSSSSRVAFGPFVTLMCNTVLPPHLQVRQEVA